ILFASTYFLKKDYKVFAFGTVFLVEILAMYFNYFKDGFLDLGMVLNYQFQYLIFIYLLNMIFEDIANSKYKRYYKLDGMLFRYLTVVDTTTRTTKKYFFYFLLIVSLFATVVGGVNATSSYVNKIEHEKYLLGLVEKFNKKENQNKQDAKNIKGKYTKEHIDYLNKQCVEQLAAPLHKQGISGIERYTNIGVTKETRYIEVNDKALDIEDGKVRVHKDNKTIVKKGFVKNNSYYFIHKKKIFKVLDVKVD
ncbi:MAG: hypothetical protein U9N59_04880, partial [Campylobacterota bacterium]|nr:hypothetical protein [Campylobacterota bacterium]